jgi:hypothetical protein
VVPYGTPGGIYAVNEVWSPPIPNTGSGLGYRLNFQAYRDLPLDNLVGYIWRVRSWSGGDRGPWRDRGMVYYGGHKDWIDVAYSFGDLVDASADSIQVALGVWDMCWVWCGTLGTGACHSHAPLIDRIRIERVEESRPQFGVRHVELFQDNFAADGTLTGTARADAAIDILPRTSPGIQPGDSVAMTISPIHYDGPAARLYVRVQNSNAPKSGPGLGSPDIRPFKAGPRWPHVGTWTDDNANVWEIFQMDTVFVPSYPWHERVPDRYCVDLNDALFVPGDTILYFFAADADGTSGNRNESYWHRTLGGQGPGHATGNVDKAAASPCEFTILPAGGYNRGGDVLYVDDADDREGPPQQMFDSAFDLLGIRELVDRYDVLGPSSAAGNSLASRVNAIAQITDPYQKIIWDSAHLSATVGDGTGMPEKSDDYCLLYEFLNTDAEDPGLYLAGEDIAEEWVESGGCAGTLRSTYMSFDLLGGDHIAHGEATSPMLVATGSAFIHTGVPDELVAYGGCAIINDFDVLAPTGPATTEVPYPFSGDGAVISQQTPTPAAQTATVILSGFSCNNIRDAFIGFPPARVEHFRDILAKLGNMVPEATGVKPEPKYTNALFNNYPNPFNPATTIRYGIKERAHVSLKIYNAAGQLVRTLIDEVQAPDEVKPVEWDGSNNAGQTVSSGVYFYKLVTKNFSLTKKMVFLK